jgi:hypothetical protein
VTDPLLPPTTDGLVMVRAPEPGDEQALIAGRDGLFQRFLGPGPQEPQPVGCIHAGGQIVGFVDYGTDQEWLLTATAAISGARSLPGAYSDGGPRSWSPGFCGTTPGPGRFPS